MVEADKGLGDGAGHGYFDGAFGMDIVVVPFQFDAAEIISFPVGYCFILFFEVVDEINTVLPVDIFYAKIIHHEAEIQGFCAVFEETGGDACGDVVAESQMGE